MDSMDPTLTNADHYRVMWENDLVRVLEYTDVPGTATTIHSHPNSVMVTLSGFRRRLVSGDREVEVEMQPGQAVWLAAQSHAGENIGTTPIHTILIELKGSAAGEVSDSPLGPGARST